MAQPQPAEVTHTVLQGEDRCVPTLNPAALMSQTPSTDSIMQLGRAFQEEVFEHNATRKMLQIQVCQRRQVERELWSAQVGNANSVRMLDWYHKAMNDRVEANPLFIDMHQRLEQQQQMSSALRSQLAEAQGMLNQHRHVSQSLLVVVGVR